MTTRIVRTQDPKYSIEVDMDAGTARLVNASTHEPIPVDEPMFMMRARDVHAVPTLAHYMTLCREEEQRFAVHRHITTFMSYRDAHVGIMKEPDTAARVEPVRLSPGPGKFYVPWAARAYSSTRDRLHCAHHTGAL